MKRSSFHNFTFYILHFTLAFAAFAANAYDDVQVTYRERHPVYGKVVVRSKKYHAHDEADTAKVGDAVTIMETRPLSATKRWRIVAPEAK